jgi:hypothetical protein
MGRDGWRRAATAHTVYGRPAWFCAVGSNQLSYKSGVVRWIRNKQAKMYRIYHCKVKCFFKTPRRFRRARVRSRYQHLASYHNVKGFTT